MLYTAVWSIIGLGSCHVASRTENPTSRFCQRTRLIGERRKLYISLLEVLKIKLNICLTLFFSYFPQKFQNSVRLSVWLDPTRISLLQLCSWHRCRWSTSFLPDPSSESWAWWKPSTYYEPSLSRALHSASVRVAAGKLGFGNLPCHCPVLWSQASDDRNEINRETKVLPHAETTKEEDCCLSQIPNKNDKQLNIAKPKSIVWKAGEFH